MNIFLQSWPQGAVFKSLNLLSRECVVLWWVIIAKLCVCEMCVRRQIKLLLSLEWYQSSQALDKVCSGCFLSSVFVLIDTCFVVLERMLEQVSEQRCVFLLFVHFSFPMHLLQTVCPFFFFNSFSHTLSVLWPKLIQTKLYHPLFSISLSPPPPSFYLSSLVFCHSWSVTNLPGSLWFDFSSLPILIFYDLSLAEQN